MSVKLSLSSIEANVNGKMTPVGMLGGGDPTTILSDKFDSSKTYNIGEYCIYNDILWKCLAQNNTVPSEGSNWHQVNITNELQSANKFEYLKGKTIAIYGSSNEVDGFSGGNNWVTLLKQKLSGYATVINKSVAGITINDSLNNFMSDSNRQSYDIIAFTCVRNAFKAQSSISDIVTKMKSLHDYVNINQDVYFASCLPYENDMAPFPMSAYDGVVYRVCSNNGYKYLDMHNWLGIPNNNATKYTSDGSHYKNELMDLIAEKAINALNKGGENLHHYKCTINPLQKAFSTSGMSLTSGIEVVDANNELQEISLDTNLKKIIRVMLKNSTGSTINANTQIMSCTNTVFRARDWEINTITLNYSMVDVIIQERAYSYRTLTNIPNGNIFIVENSLPSILDSEWSWSLT